MLDTVTLSPAQQLLEYPFRASVAFPHQENIARVLSLFEAFLEEPQSYRDGWVVLDLFDEGQTEHGYIRRKQEEGANDNKESFHYRKNLRALLTLQGTDVTKHAGFLEACETLYDACIRSTRSVMAEFARLFSEQLGDGGAFERECMLLFAKADELFLPMLRIQQYDPAKRIGDIVAIRHADKGAMTLRVHESEPGLQFGFDHVRMKDFEDAPLLPGQADLFGGRKIAHITKWRIPAWLHQVRATTLEARRNIVFFDHLDCPAVPRWYPH